MKIAFLVSFLFVQQAIGQSYSKIHRKAVVVDTHNDILTQVMERNVIFDKDLKGLAHSDLTRWKTGGVDLQLFSVWCDGKKTNPFAFALRQMDTLDAVAKRNPDKIVEISSSKELKKVLQQHKIAAMFGIEGGHMIEDDLGKLDSLYKRGARYMTLTWNNSTAWATSAADESRLKDIRKGLTAFGKDVVHRMNAMGMVVDISHVGEQTFWDVINTTSKPVIASHSSVYNICPHPRNLKDEQITAIAKNNGVIQVNFFSGFLDSTYTRKENAFLEKHRPDAEALIKSGVPEGDVEYRIFTLFKEEADAFRAPFSLVMQHIEYIIKLVGVDHVGLGSDFDGIPSPPQQLDDVTTYPLITKALVEKGYSKKDITKILGGNFLRVLKANEPANNEIR